MLIYYKVIMLLIEKRAVMDENMEYKLECMKEKFKGPLLLRILGNLLFIPIKVLFIPLIALSYILCIGLEILGKPLLSIISVIGLAVVVLLISTVINEPDMRIMNISILLFSSFVFAGLIFIVNILPQFFGMVSGILIYLLKIWF